jgi:hypothetical protein
VLSKTFQEEEIIVTLEKDTFEVIAAIVDMIILTRGEAEFPIGHSGCEFDTDIKSIFGAIVWRKKWV